MLYTCQECRTSRPVSSDATTMRLVCHQCQQTQTHLSDAAVRIAVDDDLLKHRREMEHKISSVVTSPDAMAIYHSLKRLNADVYEYRLHASEESIYLDAWHAWRRSEERLKLDKPAVGDFVIVDDQPERISYLWTRHADVPPGVEAFQLTVPRCDGSFYLDCGWCSYSGGLSLPLKHALKPATETKPGRCWISHNNNAGAGQSVDVDVPCRVWLIA